MGEGWSTRTIGGMETGPARTSPVVDYRSPGVGGHRVARAAELLGREAALGMAAAGGKLLLGAGLTLVGPLIVAALVHAASGRFGGGELPSFGATFAAACAAVVPLAMWYERRTRGRFFEDAVRGETPTREASSYGEYELQGATFLWTAFVELALTGPRLLWDVYDRARAAPGEGRALRAAAAEVAVALLDAGEGMPVRRLMRPGLGAAEVARAAQYLVECGWGGTSRRRERVWLLTPAAERLGRTLGA